MRYITNKNKKNRIIFSNNEKQLLILKSLINNYKIKNSLRILLIQKLLNYNTNMYKNRITNRCIFTGRKNILLKKYRLSRLQLPEYANKFFIKGYLRNSW